MAHPVSQQVSLGPVEDDRAVVLSRCEVVGHQRVGDVGALIAVAEEVDVLGAFDEQAPGDGLGPSLGELIVAVALQRVCGPGAKRELPEFLESCLPLFSVLKGQAFSGQAFHRATRSVSDEVYDAVQATIALRAVEKFGLSTDVLAYDTTNFDTFIDSTTDASLARRGKAKSKRGDLRVVGLALMTSATGSVPLFHRTYAGNENDKCVLEGTLGALADLHRKLGQADRTLVRDGGFYAEQLELRLEEADFHSVTVLPLSAVIARDALNEAVGKMKRLPGKLQAVRAWRKRTTIGELDRTLLIVESPELLKGQVRGMEQAEGKALAELRRYQERLEAQRAGTARGRNLTATSLATNVAELLRREWLSEFIHVHITGERRTLSLTYEIDSAARDRLIETRLGKRVVVTDKHEWSSERIVCAFRSQWHVERAFRRMKRGDVSPWGPSYQWTNDSIRAHTFATVLGLQLATLAKLSLQQHGIDKPVRTAIKLLADIKLTLLREYPQGKGRPREVRVAPRLSVEAQRAVKIFRLDRWTGLFSATRPVRSSA